MMIVVMIYPLLTTSRSRSGQSWQVFSVIFFVILCEARLAQETGLDVIDEGPNVLDPPG